MFIGTGTTISFNAIAVLEILDVTPPGISRESVESSVMSTTIAHTFIPTFLYDGGELTLEVGFDPDLAFPFVRLTAATIITFPDSGATTWTFQSFVTGYEPADPLEDRMTASITFKVTGEITIA